MPGPKTGCGEPRTGEIVVSAFGPLVIIGAVLDQVNPDLKPFHAEESRPSCPVTNTYVSVIELLANPLPGICVLEIRFATPPML